MKRIIRSNLLLFLFITGFGDICLSQSSYIRINQCGYLSADQKIATAFSEKKLKGRFMVINEDGDEVYKGSLEKADPLYWGQFYHYYLDFSDLSSEGNYSLKLADDTKSTAFNIGAETFKGYTEDILVFMRQQRCGYNPFFDIVCHQHDGRIFYGHKPDSTYIDTSGGWHDAGDQLKYLITGSFATAFMILSYELEPDKFADTHDDLGRAFPNGIPDILDEAKWGLDWIHNLHPEPDVLIHQIADDRDHRGWKRPDNDESDYGWGGNSYRTAYVANGKPQGLNKYMSETTGLANIAGRSAAAMALGYKTWLKIDSAYAFKCLKAAVELYRMGKKQEGYQQGNSYGAPYRYNEDTWTDDMEWAAAELYSILKEKNYLDDAVHYARLTGTHSWMDMDSAAHYQKYPFINIGHYALYQVADETVKKEVAEYYKSGIEKNIIRAGKTPFKVGVPFIWCSNNLVTALVSQIILYEKMTGDLSYHGFLLAQRDWLFGNNPWGTSMFMNIPKNGEYPQDVHTSTWALTGIEVPGGLIDGPVYYSIYKNLKGLELLQPDEFAEFQNDIVVYHDDIGDYSTNEPTMDGTASAVLMMAYFGVPVQKK
jgi:hypothetical protein